MDDRQFKQILSRFGFSWSGYRRVRKGVKKRLARRMQEIRCRNIEAYIGAIEKDPKERQCFERLMTVSISRFFRDRKVWEIIQDRILPELVKKSPQTINIWFAGCASGEEVYSFKIVWADERNSNPHMPPISILATDLGPENLERAKAAIYPRSSLKEAPETIRTVYFETTPHTSFKVKSNIKDGIVWQIHHLLAEPPKNRFDLIFMRNNLLTYYTDRIKIPAIKRVVNCLASRGFLIIGRHEKLPIGVLDVIPLKESTIIFQK